jgi:hypothetical protein
MRRKFLIAIILIIILGGCSPASSDRSNVLSWAKKIAALEKQMNQEMHDWRAFVAKTGNKKPSQSEIALFNQYNNDVNGIYYELARIQAPPPAREVQVQYAENYLRIYNSVRNYYYFINSGDPAYLEKSNNDEQEATLSGQKAGNDFAELLQKYSISCTEIDFCQ